MRLRRLIGDTLPLQAAGALALVAQNVLGPWWYGREAFGEATRALALPYLLQGLIEPIMISLWVTSTAAAAAGAALRRRVLFDAMLVLAGGCGAACTLAIAVNGSRIHGIASFIAAAIVYPLLILTTALIACLYARKDFNSLAVVLTVNALSFVVALMLARPWSAAGFVMAIAASHLSVQLVLRKDVIVIWRDVRDLAALRGRTETMEARPWGRYVAALAPKASLLWFNAGVLFVASLLLVPSELAHLKIAIVIAFAVLHALPVTPYVLQAHSVSAVHHRARQRLGHSLRLLAVLSFGIAGFLWLVMPSVQEWLLGESTERFRAMAWAAPAIAMTALLGGVLIVFAELRALVMGALAGIVVSLAALAFINDIAIAMLLGLYSTALAYAAAFALSSRA